MTSAGDQRGTGGDDGFFRRLFEDSALAMVATDPSLHIRSWNAAAARMFGAEKSAMLGTSVLSVLPMASRAAAERLLQSAVQACEHGDLEFHYRDEHGAQRELIMTISPIMNESGGAVGASICVRDITRRIRLQNERLENRKMAALGHMAGAFSHYFNNILGGIVTSVDFASDSGDPVLQERVLRQTSRGLMRATNLLHSLLRFAEGDTVQDHLSDYSEVIYSLADDVEKNLHRGDIRLELRIGGLPVVAVPRAQLDTVLRHIVQNAVDAMPDGGTLSLEGELVDGRLVTRIRDTGRGMTEEEMSHLFEPFFSTKGDLGTTTRAPGLGLAVAHGIVQYLGGSISAESVPGEGTVFTVTIPAAGS